MSCLDAKSLMVGDWVIVKPNMLPIKVAAIHAKKVGYHATNKLYWVRMDLLEPIPLTAEILERNGFEARGDGYFAFYYEYGRYIEVVRIYLDNNIATTNIQRGDYRDFMTNCKLQVKFVNELQHALRLCGIDKTIEL